LKNKGKGGKARKKGKRQNEEAKRELVFKEVGQEYAQVTAMLGDGRLRALCFDNVERLCKIRGKMMRRVWIGKDDIILVGLRDFEDGKADVILKYTLDESRQLQAYGELPNTAKLNDADGGDAADGVQFGEEDDVQFDFDIEEI